MKFGFIGMGNMGSAIVGGMMKNYRPFDIVVTDKNKAQAQAISEKYGVFAGEDNLAAAEAEYLFLCVKPNILFSVIDEIKDTISETTTIISIAAGKSIAEIQRAFGKEIGIIRVMPNTPALVGEAMSAVCANKNVTKEQIGVALNIFRSLGKAEEVPESLMDAVTGISGSAPAYVFMFIEAMADAAVKAGMTRNLAYTFAAQAVLGSAKMVLETKKHPGELKDMVCSPGGTTIDAVAELEKSGFRSGVIEAVTKCVEKSKNM